MKKNFYFVLGSVALVLALAGLAFMKWQAGQKEIAGPSPSGMGDLQQSPEAKLVRDDSPKMGPATASITMVEFLDPECESCAMMYPVVKRLLKEYPQIHFVVRYMPFHGNSAYAAAALQAAGEQGKYWEAMEVLFTKQHEWGSHHAPRPDLIPTYMRGLGLDMKKFNTDARKEEYREMVERDRRDGLNLGVNGTPTFFVNGKRVYTLSYDGLKEAIESER
jgi:protein-disulfide isomerase